MGMILPVLVFFFAVNTAWAFFTATATEVNKETSTGLIKLVFKSDPTYTVSSVVVADGYVLPGQSVQINGTLVNQSYSDIYALVKVQASVGGVLGTSVYYTPGGKLVYDGTEYKSYTQDEVTIDAPTGSGQSVTYTESPFQVAHGLGFEEYSNTNQGEEIKFYITGLGVQTENITHTNAVKYLVETIGK